MARLVTVRSRGDIESARTSLVLPPDCAFVFVFHGPDTTQHQRNALTRLGDGACGKTCLCVVFPLSYALHASVFGRTARPWSRLRAVSHRHSKMHQPISAEGRHCFSSLPFPTADDVRSIDLSGHAPDAASYPAPEALDSRRVTTVTTSTLERQRLASTQIDGCKRS